MYDALLMAAARRATNGGNCHRMYNLMAAYEMAAHFERQLRTAISIFPSSGLLVQLSKIERKENCIANELRAAIHA